MVYKFFDKKISERTVKNENISNKELAEGLHKPIIKNFKKRKVQTKLNILNQAKYAQIKAVNFTTDQ